MTTIRLATLTLAVLAAPLAAVAQPAAAASDARWTPWLGCWRAADDASASGARVCVTAEGAGVRLRTIVGGQTVGDESRVASGVARPVADAGCRGTETTQWSSDGRRAYRVTDAACASEPARTLASVSFFVTGPTWVDVQTVTHKGDTSVRVTRYIRAAAPRLADGSTAQVPLAAGVTDLLTSRGWTTDDVREASRFLPPDGVQAAIGEGPTAFRLNAKSLTQLADGGVAERVIDLMVALTYPEKFVIDRPGSGGGGGGFSPWNVMGPLAFDPFGAALIGPAALYDCYAPYGWASTSYWSSCSGYGGYPGYYNGYYGNFGNWVPVTGTIDPGTPGAGATGTGRVVNGRGYTQVRPADPVTAGVVAGDRSSGNASNQSGGNSGTASGGSNSGATSSGYSGGSMSGGGGGGDRVAVPRPPGI